MKKKNKLPNFKSMTREEEAKWWDTHSFVDFWDDLEDAEVVFDLGKKRDETIVVRVQKDIKDKMRQVAKKKGVDVSTLARMWFLERLQSRRQ